MYVYVHIYDKHTGRVLYFSDTLLCDLQSNDRNYMFLRIRLDTKHALKLCIFLSAFLRMS